LKISVFTNAGFIITFVDLCIYYWRTVYLGSVKMALKGVEWWPIKLVGRTEVLDVGRV